MENKNSNELCNTCVNDLLSSHLNHNTFSILNENIPCSCGKEVGKTLVEEKLANKAQGFWNAPETKKMKFTVPVGKASIKEAEEAEEAISELISNYSEKVNWDDETGTIHINGSKTIPYSKQIWLGGDADQSAPMELSTDEWISVEKKPNWFKKILKKIKK